MQPIPLLYVVDDDGQLVSEFTNQQVGKTYRFIAAVASPPGAGTINLDGGTYTAHMPGGLTWTATTSGPLAAGATAMVGEFRWTPGLEQEPSYTIDVEFQLDETAGTTRTFKAKWLPGDCNLSGEVNVDDLLQVQLNWGQKLNP
jgi:hypothetical protein